MQENEVKEWLNAPPGIELVARLGKLSAKLKEDRGAGLFDHPENVDKGQYERGRVAGVVDFLDFISSEESLADFIMEDEDE